MSLMLTVKKETNKQTRKKENSTQKLKLTNNHRNLTHLVKIVTFFYFSNVESPQDSVSLDSLFIDFDNILDKHKVSSQNQLIMREIIYISYNNCEVSPLFNMGSSTHEHQVSKHISTN